MDNSAEDRSNETETHFNALVDGIAYMVTASPIGNTNERKFSIVVNNGPRDVFAWDNEMKMYKGLDDQSAILPDGLMIEINKKLLELEK